jgi:hypothetical protein
MNAEMDKNESGVEITLAEICKLLDGTLVCGESRSEETAGSACGSDLMSDVLALTKPGSVLLTGLTNPQVVRTAEMLDLKAIVFVRNKQPDEKTVRMAQSIDLVLILSPYPLYESCGRLYKAGLAGCYSGNGARRPGLDNPR